MANKVLLLDNSVDRYIKLADRRAEEEDFFGALGFLFSAEKASKDSEITLKIAQVYADMGLYELSNKYLYKYIHFAPSDRVAIAYEELAINYFYLDNLWASGFYFHKKLSVDGYITKEGLDQEILDFFSGEEFKKTAYRIVYPIERADYSLEVKNGKRLIALGGFKDASKTLLKIPKEKRSEEISGDLAIALFMDEDLDRAEKVCKESIEMHGDNLTAYCNLSTIFDMREDFDKSDYYYQKALKLRKGEGNEAYKIATCAVERSDHVTAEECLQTILKERPYELSMRFFYGLAKLNLNKVDEAIKELGIAYRNDPNDIAVKYYLDLAKRVKDGDANAIKALPVKYVKELPKSVAAKYATKIGSALKSQSKITTLLKNKQNREIFTWGMLYGEEAVMRTAVLIVSSLSIRQFKNFIEPFLIDPEVRDDLKRLLIYLLIFKGDKSKIGVVSGCYYCSFTPKKLKFLDGPTANLYLSAYALCMSKIVFFEMEDFNKIGVATERIFKAFNGVITEAEITNEELAGFILLNSGYKQFETKEGVRRLFDLSDYKIEKLTKILQESQSK